MDQKSLERDQFRSAFKCWQAAGQLEHYAFPLISNRIKERVFYFMIGVFVGAIVTASLIF